MLQNAKRQLETDLVVEQRIRNKGSDRDSPSSTDDEQDEDDTRISNEDGSEDVFFDCNTDLARLSSTPVISNDAQNADRPSTSGGWSQRPSAGQLLCYLSIRCAEMLSEGWLYWVCLTCDCLHG